MAITSAQCKAARTLISWSQDLAAASKVAKATIANFEGGKGSPYDRTHFDIQAALEAAGVIFVDDNGEGPGMRVRKARTNPCNPTDGEGGIIDSNESREASR